MAGLPATEAVPLRDRNGDHEVDLIAELDTHRIVALEVKAFERDDRVVAAPVAALWS